MPFCRNCGTPVKDNHPFCMRCGAPQPAAGYWTGEQVVELVEIVVVTVVIIGVLVLVFVPSLLRP